MPNQSPEPTAVAPCFCFFGSHESAVAQLFSLGNNTIVRPLSFIQKLVGVAFGLAFIGFGIGAFCRADHAQHQLDDKLRSIRDGENQPATLVVVRKYRDPGKSGLPHVVFSSDRQPAVSLAVTRDIFNAVKPGDTMIAYSFSDGYFIPQNQVGDTGGGKWFFLGLGIFIGGGVLAFVFAGARTRRPCAGMAGATLRDRWDNH